MNISYGQEPKVIIEHIDLLPSEMCFVQYMPIRMAKNENLGSDLKVPNHIIWTKPLIDSLPELEADDYVYLTVKHMYVNPQNMGNRPGWHSDGFETEDVNYIWTDTFPTEFCIQPFNISDNCAKSMTDMEEQARSENIRTYGCKALLKLDKFNIHRTPTIGEGYRTFVKLSVSKDKYNLKGNAHNYLFDYEWNMVDRSTSRNHPNQ